MSEIDRILNSCTECGLCVEECDFLQKIGSTPKELAARFAGRGPSADPAIPYSCNICSLCRQRCPEKLDVGLLAGELRRELVKAGAGPLPAHRPVIEGQQLYVSEAFKAALPARDGPTNRVFFPGCALAMYSPGLVEQTYRYLSEKLPGTGVLLGCCGGPAYLLGDAATFEPISLDVAAQVKSLGAAQVIAACPFCLKLLREHHPELNPVSLYAVLEEIGVPARKPGRATVSVHDPCTTRLDQETQASVRSLLKQAGFRIKEIPHSRGETQCCGMGGMVYAVDPELGRLRSRRTLDEAKGDLVTYCATCRETLRGQGGCVVHVLDLLFNSRWKRAVLAPPQAPEAAIANLKQLKKQLLQ